jgi:hypothetical protein
MGYFHFKKNLVKIYKRTKKPSSNVRTKIARSTSYTRSTSGASSMATDYYNLPADRHGHNHHSGSSGYTSTTDMDSLSNQQIYPDTNIDLRNQIKHLLDYQFEVVTKLTYGLENFVRPMTVIINGKLYHKLVQNMEKIVAITEFVRNQIVDSIKLTTDVYTSTLSVLNEYVSFSPVEPKFKPTGFYFRNSSFFQVKIVRDSYEIFLAGYQQSRRCARNPQIRKCIQVSVCFFSRSFEFYFLKIIFSKTFNLKYKTNFDLDEFLRLPIQNIRRTYKVLDVLFTASNDNNECLINLHENYKQMKTKLAVVSSSASSTASIVWSSPVTAVNSNPLDYDYVDVDGNKYYFV